MAMGQEAGGATEGADVGEYRGRGAGRDAHPGAAAMRCDAVEYADDGQGVRAEPKVLTTVDNSMP